MIRIRLRRVGGTKQPSYRVVVADKEAPRDGRFLEILGFYNPRTDPLTLHLEEARIYEWLNKGAQPSESVHQLFRTAGLLERYKRLKAGEPVETLLQEVTIPEGTLVDSTTRHAPGKKVNKSSK